MQKEADELHDGLSPKIEQSVETPTTSVKRKGRGPAKRTQLQKIKDEAQAEVDGPSSPTPASSDDESEYNDTPVKRTTKKRGRGGRSTRKKVTLYKEPSVEDASDEEDELEEEEEFVDEAGGENVVYKTNSSSDEPTQPTDTIGPTGATYQAGMKYPPTGGKTIPGEYPVPAFIKEGRKTLPPRQDSFAPAPNFDYGQIEDVFVENGVQRVQHGQLLPSPAGFGGSHNQQNFVGGYGQFNPMMMHNGYSNDL
jgi:hypothetical protein